MSENPSTALTGTVEKIIQSCVSNEPERAQIVVEGTDQLYKELRIENTLTDQDGMWSIENRGQSGGHGRGRATGSDSERAITRIRD